MPDPARGRLSEGLMTILHAFYDLAVSPPTFDFIVFLELAELARRRNGCDAVRVVFVPGPNQGFRDDKLPPDIATRRALMRDLVIPATFLLPYLAGVTCVQSRAEAQALFQGAG